MSEQFMGQPLQDNDVALERDKFRGHILKMPSWLHFVSDAPNNKQKSILRYHRGTEPRKQGFYRPSSLTLVETWRMLAR